MKAVLLVSGGLDSYVAYHYLTKDGYEVLPLHINYKGKYSNKEQDVVNELFPGIKIDRSLNFFGQEEGEKAFLKNRNAFFALVASKYGHSICMAGLKDDNVGDKSPSAFITMENLLTELNGEVYSVFSPFWRMEKEEVLKWYINEKLSIPDLLQTTSCYHPTEYFCGECPSCFRKYCAFVSNGIEYTLPDFTNNALAREYKIHIANYSETRQNSIHLACELMGV
jgi:7-cyano-7-deazaguanine synthase in queuosine biosynthesis